MSWQRRHRAGTRVLDGPGLGSRVLFIPRCGLIHCERLPDFSGRPPCRIDFLFGVVVPKWIQDVCVAPMVTYGFQLLLLSLKVCVSHSGRRLIAKAPRWMELFSEDLPDRLRTLGGRLLGQSYSLIFHTV